MGFAPDAFWRQTPVTLSLIIDGRRAAAESELKRTAWLAWNIAYLQNAKNPPSLADFIEGVLPKPQQTLDEQRAALRAFTEQAGGAVS